MKYEKDVIKWAEDRGIFAESEVPIQLKKTAEEVIEAIEAYYQFDREYFKLELGDILVTVILAAKMADLDAEECLEAAFNKISKRTGKMQNGLFVKDHY